MLLLLLVLLLYMGISSLLLPMLSYSCPAIAVPALHRFRFLVSLWQLRRSRPAAAARSRQSANPSRTRPAHIRTVLNDQLMWICRIKCQWWHWWATPTAANQLC